MIKIPLSPEELDQLAIEFYKDIQNAPISISAKIQARPMDFVTPVFDYLLQHIEEIIKGKPRQLENHIASLSPRVEAAKAAYTLANHNTKPTAKTWFKNEILKIFNYDFNHLSFTKWHSGILATNHAQRLNMTTCPYCNANFTFTIRTKKYRTRPQFDHFFNKARHPYFALSFYNLIPSCYVCNSNVKSSQPFLYSSHIHPFFEGIEGLYKFKTNIDSVDFLLGKKDFTLSFEENPNANARDLIRAKNSLDDFEIEDRYNYHRDYAGEIIKKSYFYKNTVIKELFENYTINGQKLFGSEEEIIELLLGNYLYEHKLHKRILSKLTKDVADEFGIRFKAAVKS